MLLFIQLLDYFPDGIAMLNSESLPELDTSNSKVFRLINPITKKTKKIDGSCSYSCIYFLRLIQTIEKGAFEVYGYMPENPQYKIYLGLAYVQTSTKEPYDFKTILQ